MPSIISRKINKKTYYYLEHSRREKNNIKKYSHYLGHKIPQNINHIKDEFIQKYEYNNHNNNLQIIRRNYKSFLNSLSHTAKEKYLYDFALRFTYETNKIEGGTLTKKDTIHLFEHNIAPNKSLKDIEEAKGHKHAYDHMLQYKKEVTISLLLYWHKTIFKQSDSKIAGKIRTHQVKIAGSDVQLARPFEINVELKEFITWYQKNKNKLNPFILASIAHLKFVTIHPFADGNGRVARLLLNFILHQNHYPLTIIRYTQRQAYYTALEQAQKKLHDYIFVRFLVKHYLKEQKHWLEAKSI